MSKSKDYEIICKIGQGSFGTVYKVKRKTDKQILVMKMIKIPTLSKKHQQESLHEVTILSSLNNPYIVKYFESFVENSTLHIIMEYCEKGDLSQILKKQPLSEGKVWKFFIQLCIGLEYLHNRQILHRDIKALNIFLSGDDNVRIGDMGVAKIMNNTGAFAQTQVGSPYYLSPELCEEKPYNNKSDVWALGCVLYEMCTGKHPFTAPNQAALILRIVKGTYTPLGFEFSASLREIIDLCLEKDLKKRPNVQCLLLKPEVEGKVEEFGIFAPIGSVLYKQKKNFDEFEAGLKKSAGEEKKSISAIKIVSDVQRQIFENRKIVSQQSVKSRPVSAYKPEISRFESPTKSKLVAPVKIPVNLFSKIETRSNLDIPEVQSAHRIEKVVHKPKQSLNEMLEKIQSSQIQPYFAARNMSPFKAEIKISKTPAIKPEKEPKFNNSRLAFKPSPNIYEVKQIYKQKIPGSAKIPKFEGSLEDIKLVQNLPEYPSSKTKLSVKYLQESSPVRQVNAQSSVKKQFRMLLRPLVDPVYKSEIGENKFFSFDEDDWTILKNKEKESVKNEESLRRQCSKLRSEVIRMIGGDKFNEMHGIFTSIIMVPGI